jgi:hypothetical protein
LEAREQASNISMPSSIAASSASTSSATHPQQQIVTSMDTSSSSSARSLAGISSNTVFGSGLSDTGNDDEHERNMVMVLEHEILPGSMQRLALSDTQLAMLSRSEANPSFDFRTLYASYSCDVKTAQANITKFLKTVHRYKVIMSYEDLPQTAKTLLKIDRQDTYYIRIREIKGPVTVGRAPKKTASYMHLGVERGLLGTSCGLVSKWQYVNTLRNVYTIFPELIPHELYGLIRPQPGMHYLFCISKFEKLNIEQITLEV